MGISIRDIAKLAGVSPTTVSFVINNKKGVSEETRERVRRIIKENGYSEKMSVARHKSVGRRICIVKYSIDKASAMDNSELDSYLISCLHSICSKKQIIVSMTMCNADNFQTTMKNIIHERYSGVIIIGTLLEDEQIRFLDSMDLAEESIIVIDNDMRNTCVNSVGTSNREISHIAVQYLHSLGFDSIGYLHSNVPISKCRARARGFDEIMAQLNIQNEVRIPLRPTLDGAYNDMLYWMNHGFQQPKAFYVDTGIIALGAMRAMQERGIRIPEDVSIIAGDDMLLGMFSMPSLTAVSTSYKSICKIALTLIERKNSEAFKQNNAEHISIVGKLVIRNSAGKNSQP